MKRRDITTTEILVGVVVLCIFAVTAVPAGQKPLTKAEIPVPAEQMPGYILNELRADAFVKEHFGWQLAFCQHPMYLLIDEDRGEPPVGERIPPWGAKTADDYVERVKRNLHSLEELDELKLNYQWSAVELESMCRRFPDVYAWMKRLYKQGKLDFLDGTYSQAHLQVLSSESNWRQFEFGHEIYEKLFDKKVDTYARQETGLHLQLPQLLKIFGYKYATLPAFVATVRMLDGGFEFVEREGRLEAINGSEFVQAVGLDSSTIPFYLMPQFDEVDELQQDLFSTPKLTYAFPDLAEVGPEQQARYRLYDWVLLPEALEQRYAEAPPRTKAQVFTDWSYIEGVWAEELLRTMRSAEEAALLAEGLCCMAHAAGVPVNKSAQIKDVWKAILKSQHHDISWIEVTDLRRKSIDRLKKAIETCRDIMNEVTRKLLDQDSESVAVFNALPRQRKCLVRIPGVKKPAGGSVFQQFKGDSLGFVNVPAGGAASFAVVEDASFSKEKGALPEIIKTNKYIVKLSEGGLIEQITSRDGSELLDTSEYIGGEIRARINKQWANNRSAKCTYYTGPVCDIVERSTTLGPIPVLERYYFFKEQPFIKAEIEFDFDGNEVGYFWIDKTKINVYYPTRGEKVYQDIPFGYIEAKQNRPLFATNWVYCGGLVYVNRGTVKHWVQDGVIANVLAWGGNHFTNRLHWEWLARPQFDIRLYGKQKIEYFLLPVGKFDGNKIVHDVTNLTSPVYVTAGKAAGTFYQVQQPDLAITSVYKKDGKIWARGYKLPSAKKSKYRDWEIFNTPVENP